jgi:hypothetical protein
MCPICMATIAAIVVKVSSAGGITALVATKLRSRTRGAGSAKHPERDAEHLPQGADRVPKAGCRRLGAPRTPS